MDMERLQKQMDFIVEVDKVKQIIRQTYLSDASRKEDDAEHSWHLALMAVLLSEYSNEEVDLKKVVPHIPQMRKNMADALGIPESKINVKATTEEGLGFTGSGEGISSQAICLLTEIQD